MPSGARLHRESTSRPRRASAGGPMCQAVPSGWPGRAHDCAPDHDRARHVLCQTVIVAVIGLGAGHGRDLRGGSGGASVGDRIGRIPPAGGGWVSVDGEDRRRHCKEGRATIDRWKPHVRNGAASFLAGLSRVWPPDAAVSVSGKRSYASGLGRRGFRGRVRRPEAGGRRDLGRPDQVEAGARRVPVAERVTNSFRRRSGDRRTRVPRQVRWSTDRPIGRIAGSGSTSGSQRAAVGAPSAARFLVTLGRRRVRRRCRHQAAQRGRLEM